MSDPAVMPRPTAAGMYDFYLGGTAHTPVDRAAAEQIMKLIPDVADAAWANRGFLQRAVKRLATEYGVRQFLDIGSGLPTQHNTHDVAASAVPDARVVYVDIEPEVIARGRQLLTGVENATVIGGDMREPEAVLRDPETRRLIDFSAPVGLLLVAVLHFVPDDADPWALVARCMDELPSGSYLALSHISVAGQFSEEVQEAGRKIYAATATPPIDRTKTEIERFFTGLELMPPYQGAAPGMAYIGVWGADDPALADSEGSRFGYAAVARKP